MPNIQSLYDPDREETINFDLDNPKQKEVYEREKIRLSGSKKSNKPEFLSGEDIKNRLAGGALGAASGGFFGGVPGAVIGGLGGAAFPPEDATDIGMLAVGGQGAGAFAKGTGQLLKNAPNKVRTIAQMLSGMAYQGGENALVKSIKGQNPMPTTAGELANIAAGGLPGIFTNMDKTPSARSNKVLSAMGMVEEGNPSQNRDLSKKGSELIRKVEQEQQNNAKFTINLEDQIKDYKRRDVDMSKHKATLQGKKAALIEDTKTQREIVKQTYDVDKANYDKSLMEVQNKIKDGERMIGELDDQIKRTGDMSLGQRRSEILQQTLADKIQVDKLKSDFINRTIQKAEDLQFDPKVLQANKTLRNNIIQINREKEEVKGLIQETQDKIGRGEFGNLEIANLFKRNSPANGGTAEGLIDDLLGQNPQVIKDFLEHYSNKNKGEIMRGAILQRIVSQSFDPQTNSLGGGMSYFAKNGKGNITDRLEHVLGSREKAENVERSFQEVADSAERILKNKLSSQLGAIIGTGLVFTAASLWDERKSGLDKAKHIVAGELGTLAYLKWGTLLNKMASSPAFNKVFTEWMKDGAPSSMLQKGSYLMSQLRDLTFEVPTSY